MTSQEKQLLDEIRLCLPVYNYESGIAKELVLSHKKLDLKLNSNECLSLRTYFKVDLSTEFINEAHNLLITLLKCEQESNKESWYHYYG